VHENRREWDKAKEQYQYIVDDTAAPKPLKDLAAQSITRLETLRKAPLIAPPATGPVGLDALMPRATTGPSTTQGATRPAATTGPASAPAPAPAPAGDAKSQATPAAPPAGPQQTPPPQTPPPQPGAQPAPPQPAPQNNPNPG
jgi:hypothetical protein